MILEETDIYTIYIHKEILELDKNRDYNIVITFPSSKGNKYDLLNLNVLEPILNEDIFFVFVQTQDYDCFYNQTIDDFEKIKNLRSFLEYLETELNKILKKYEKNIHKIPILLGCSMGTFYTHYLFLKNPYKYNCINLGGVCNLEQLDYNSTHNFNEDKVINYKDKFEYWKQFNPFLFNPCFHENKNINFTGKLISCFGSFDDSILISDSYKLYSRIPTWNYIKLFNLGHNYESWRIMLYDIFKSNNIEFHSFRNEFYSLLTAK